MSKAKLYPAERDIYTQLPVTQLEQKMSAGRFGGVSKSPAKVAAARANIAKARAAHGGFRKKYDAIRHSIRSIRERV